VNRNPPSDLLQLPSKAGVRRVALNQLADAGEAKTRLRRKKDDEALHDFRVALRRLRSTFRLYRSELDDSVKRGATRRLRRLAALTTESRDLEVHLEWLESLRGKMARGEAAGLQLLRDRLRQRKRKADSALRRVIDTRFSAVHRRLEKQLGWYTTIVKLDEPGSDSLFAHAVAERLRDGGRALAAALSLVKNVSDVRRAHEARIAGKRLRYAVEPVAALIPDGDELLSELKQLQDTLGDLHDAHVFADEVAGALADVGAEESRRLSAQVVEGRMNATVLRRERRRDPRPGLLAVATKLTERANAAFTALTPKWLGSHASDFFAQVAAASRALDALALRGQEIERKFLLSALPDEVHDHRPVEIEQGYLPGDSLVERLRRESEDGQDRYFRTVKSGRGVRRLELEEETSPDLFEAMWPLTEGKRVTKRRYRVPDTTHGVTWEIDEFVDRELVLAEVELPDADSAPRPPAWLRDVVVRDVTGEDEFVNANLAR
jgi:CHAD domain-containing protein/CYTH domain-containing protein